MSTIYKLIIEDDEGKTTVYPLSHGEISIGRKEGNTIRLMERNVSRRHARLRRANGSVFIEDLDSYNGIRINGERINGRYEVKEGDLVEIGDYHLALQAAEIEDEASSFASTSRTELESPRGNDWPTAGTLPDMQVPAQMLASVRALQSAPTKPGVSAPRDTLVETVPPPPAAMPSVSPPSKTVPTGFMASHGSEAATIEARIEPFISPPPRGDEGGPRALPPFPTPGGLPPAAVPLFPSSRPTGLSESETRPSMPKPSGATEGEVLASAPQPSVGPARTSAVPRLVCVSTNYAGKEFALTRPELIIGRVEDNDIVIEHRSVSRNHAKIIFDGRAHKIIDLQSANGILVNGEEYAMTDLRKCDLIELGHVRFRFVPAGEPFVANDEELREMREAGAAPEIQDGFGPALRSAETTPPASGPSSASTLSTPGSKPPISQKKQSEAVTEVPSHFDPSMAATVTDTPISALTAGPTQMPEVETPSSPAAAPPALPSKRVDPPAADRATIRSDTAAPRSAAPEHPVSARTNGAGLGSAIVPKYGDEPLTRPRIASADDEPLEPPRAGVKVGFIVLGVIAVVVLAIVLATTLFGGDEKAEEKEIRHAGEPQHAAEPAKPAPQEAREVEHEAAHEPAPLNANAVPASAQVAPPPSEEHPREEENHDPSQEGMAEEESGAGSEIAELGRGRSRPLGKRSPGAVSKIALRKPGAGAKELKARDFFESGKKSLFAGDLTRAEDLFTRCIKTFPLPECYRSLGVIYADTNPAKSVQNYRRYLDLAPNAPDAPNLRKIIDNYEREKE